MNAKPSRRSPSAAATSTDAARARIRAAGLRCTPARLAVMERLAAAAGPRTHAELAADLAAGARHAGSGYDKATIYRNLVELTEAGLVSRMELGDHVWRFEIKGQAKDGSSTAAHPHFVCTECGGVSCLDGLDVAITPQQSESTKGRRPARGGRGDAGHHRIGSVSEVLLKGRCEDCT
jgi:Fur family ferric uptake transcriptional regulator